MNYMSTNTALFITFGFGALALAGAVLAWRSPTPKLWILLTTFALLAASVGAGELDRKFAIVMTLGALSILFFMVRQPVSIKHLPLPAWIALSLSAILSVYHVLAVFEVYYFHPEYFAPRMLVIPVGFLTIITWLCLTMRARTARNLPTLAARDFNLISLFAIAIAVLQFAHWTDSARVIAETRRVFEQIGAVRICVHEPDDQAAATCLRALGIHPNTVATLGLRPIARR